MSISYSERERCSGMNNVESMVADVLYKIDDVLYLMNRDKGKCDKDRDDRERALSSATTDYMIVMEILGNEKHKILVKEREAWDRLYKHLRPTENLMSKVREGRNE